MAFSAAAFLDNDYGPLVADSERQYGIPSGMLYRLLDQESRFNPHALGPMTRQGRARGIAQFIDSTAAEYGIDPLDPKQAIPGAARYLSSLAGKYGGDYNRALAAYNWGPGNVDRWTAAGADPDALPMETLDYVNVIGGGGNDTMTAAEFLDAPDAGPAQSAAEFLDAPEQAPEKPQSAAAFLDGEPATASTGGGQVVRGISRGAHNLAATGYGLLALGADELDAQKTLDWALEGYKEQSAAAAANPRIRSHCSRLRQSGRERVWTPTLC